MENNNTLIVQTPDSPIPLTPPPWTVEIKIIITSAYFCIILEVIYSIIEGIGLQTNRLLSLLHTVLPDLFFVHVVVERHLLNHGITDGADPLLIFRLIQTLGHKLDTKAEQMHVK